MANAYQTVLNRQICIRDFAQLNKKESKILLLYRSSSLGSATLVVEKIRD